MTIDRPGHDGAMRDMQRLDCVLGFFQYLDGLSVLRTAGELDFRCAEVRRTYRRSHSLTVASYEPGHGQYRNYTKLEGPLTACHNARIFIELYDIDLPHVSGYPPYCCASGDVPKEDRAVSSSGGESCIIMGPVVKSAVCCLVHDTSYNAKRRCLLTQ